MATDYPPLITYTDGLRTPTPSTIPQRPYAGGRRVDPPLTPYNPTPKPPATADLTDVPRNFSFFRTMKPGAAPVGLPDQARTSGNLQPSGEAWGSWHEPKRITAKLPIERPNF